jgi:hypothetical protein
VFCGFTAENIREHRIEHKRAKEYARMLKADLINDTLQLRSFIAKKDSLEKRFQKLNVVLAGEKDSISFSGFYFVKETGFDLSGFVSNEATYSQMKNSGSLRYFKNSLLLAKLGFYDAQIRRYRDEYNASINIYGGIGSPYLLQYTISSDRFFKKHPGEDTTKLIKSAGYDFQSWDEAGRIIKNITNVLTTLNQYTYPDLKKTATDIIALLNEEYHLK